MTSHESFSSSPHLEIVLDDQSEYDSYYDDCHEQLRKAPDSSKPEDEHFPPRRSRQSSHKSPKPHRLIEKRRRDRMNSSLDTLLELIPHKKPTNQRRIEKTEVVEMATSYIRCLTSAAYRTGDSDKQAMVKLNAYRLGYHNCLSDTQEYLDAHPAEHRARPNYDRHMSEKEVELSDLTALPERKVHRRRQNECSDSGCGTSQSAEHMSPMSDGRSSKDHENIYQFSIDGEQSPPEQTKVPIFVLHPSGTHYIPMTINSSIVSHAFEHKPAVSRSSSVNEQFHCHPVSIPVNFHATSAVSNSSELDIQNINVVAARHQASVRPR